MYLKHPFKDLNVRLEIIYDHDPLFEQQQQKTMKQSSDM